MQRCELDVAGPLAESLLDLIRSRFGHITIRSKAEATSVTTTVSIEGLDPASERALLTLLWDTGHDVISMRSTR